MVKFGAFIFPSTGLEIEEESTREMVSHDRVDKTVSYRADIAGHGRTMKVRGTVSGFPNWYSKSWLYRKCLTINCSKVQGTLTNFPVLVYRSVDADLANKAQADGDDILFTTADGVTKLDHEIESFDSNTGKLIAWVRIPTLISSSNTIIYMYYCNSAASNQQNPTGVWDTNFKLVYHMKDDPDNSHVKDSTINGNNGTKTGADQPPEADAKIGKGQDFDGVSGHVITSNTYTVVPGAFTAKGWWKREGNSGSSHPDWHAICNRINGRHNVNLSVKKDGTLVRLQIYRTDGGYSNASCTIPTPNEFHLIAGTYDGVDKIYAICDGVWGSPTTLPYPPATGTSQVIIGRDGPDWSYTNGLIDELSISASFRGVDWLKTCYNNENDPAAFIFVGDEEYSTEAIRATIDSLADGVEREFSLEDGYPFNTWNALLIDPKFTKVTKSKYEYELTIVRVDNP